MNMLNKEQWKQVAGYEGLYEISSHGRVKSLRKGGRLLSQGEVKGYPRVSLFKSGRGEHFLVHRLVAIAFIPNPKNKRTVNHKNGIRNDNRVSNLEWATYSENHRHAFDVLGRRGSRLGKRAHNAILTNAQVRKIKQRLKDGVIQRVIGEEFGVSRSVISGIVDKGYYKDVK